MTHVVDVAQVLSERIAERMGAEPIVLIQAPAEYEPLAITLAAMERLHGPHGFAVMTLPAERC